MFDDVELAVAYKLLLQPMLIAAFGTYTPFATWGFSAVRKAADVLFGTHDHIHCNTMVDLAAGLKGRYTDTVVITADCPEPAIAETMRKLSVPVIAFLDDPEDATALAMTAFSFGVRESLTFSSYRLSALSGALDSGRALRFGRQTYDAEISKVMSQIQQHLTGTVDNDKLTEMVDALLPDGSGRSTVAACLVKQYPDAKMPSEYLSNLSAETKHVIRTWCGGFHPVLSGTPVERIDLPPEVLFFSPVGGDDRGYLDVCGPRRCLMWGPYIYIPAGRWLAKLDIEVADNHGGCEIEIDVLNCPTRLALVKARLPKEGVFGCEFPFEVERFDWRIELRVLLQEGMIEGRMIIRNVRLERVGELTLAVAEPQVSRSRREPAMDASLKASAALMTGGRFEALVAGS